MIGPGASPRILSRPSFLGFITNETLFVGTHTQETAALFRDATLPRSFKRQQHEERIALHNACSNQLLSIALHIRHSLAHGRFAAASHDGRALLYFENGVRSNGRFAVRARLVLSTATLETWRRVLPHELRARTRPLLPAPPANRQPTRKKPVNQYATQGRMVGSANGSGPVSGVMSALLGTAFRLVAVGEVTWA